jgi:outer membrane lipoprotein carrier protein
MAFTSSASQTQAYSVDEIINQLQTRYNSTQDLQADFSQVAALKSLGSKQKQKSDGVVYFKKPGKMRWEYKPPNEQFLISDGETLWLYLPEDQQVMVDKVQTAYSSRTPINFLAGGGKLKEDFNIKLIPDAESYPPDIPHLELLPKTTQSDFSKLILSVDPATYLVVHTSVHDLYGNITDVYFTNIRTNVNIPEDKFHFQIPKGVEVIQQK